MAESKPTLPPPPTSSSPDDISQGASTTLYFGYGSNLWLEQMHRRCPESNFKGLGILHGYRWIINDRGYANIVVSSTPEDHVYGMMYTLHGQDESRLDRNEGVPYAYVKQVMDVDIVRGAQKGNTVKGLVYIDLKRVTASKPKEEYIDRINCGIRDAVEEGMPEAYVDKYLRPFIPKT